MSSLDNFINIEQALVPFLDEFDLIWEIRRTQFPRKDAPSLMSSLHAMIRQMVGLHYILNSF